MTGHRIDDEPAALVARHRAAAARLPQPLVFAGEVRMSSASEGVISHINAATGEIQAEVPLCGAVEVDAAVAAARHALDGWRALAPVRRRDLLMAFTDLLQQHADELALLSTLENGMTQDLAANAIVPFSLAWSRYYAGWADKLEGLVAATGPQDPFIYTLPEPYGVVAVIITWNAPLLSLTMKVPAALAAGNTVVIKPAELTPFVATRYVELALEAGIPPGVINLVQGGRAAGEALTRHAGVDKISFTGGAATGRSIWNAAAARFTPLLFELGGKSANLVFADANIEEAIAFSAAAAMRASGQSCTLASRLMVEDSIYDQVLEGVSSAIALVPVGDPLDPSMRVGPLILNRERDRVLDVINGARERRDGRLVLGGTALGGALSQGAFVAPTIFADVDPASSLAQNEVFGPVLTVMRFRDEEEAIRLANATEFGLARFIQSQDQRRVRRVAGRLRSGTVAVNGAMSNSFLAPFGGLNQSGFGKEGGKAGVQEFVREKTVLVK